jgi:hypothetical protein
MHHTECHDTEIDKPEIIGFYNKTKGGVDSLVQKCRKNDAMAHRYFFRLLDISTVNSYVLHQSYRNSTNMKRYDFVKDLAMELVTPKLQRPHSNTGISREVRQCIGRVLKIMESHNEDENDKLASKWFKAWT